MEILGYGLISAGGMIVGLATADHMWRPKGYAAIVGTIIAVCGGIALGKS